jgi:ABC-type antimicrobial peptide transport system permease subunit
MSEGVIYSFNQMASAGQADLMAEQAGVSDLSLSEIDERLADRIATHPEVAGISKIILGFPSAPGVPYFILFGLDPREDYIRHYRIYEGRMIQRSGEIVIGRFAANGLDKQIGDRLNLAGGSFRVVGFYENGSVYEDAGGLVSLEDAQDLLNKPRKISLLGIRLVDRSRADAVAAELERMAPDVIVARADAFTDRLQDFATMDAVFNALGLLTMVVGGVVMMNAMLMSVFERTQEIGVLRALGWRRGRVLRLIVGEALLLSVLSSLAGIGVGVGLNALMMAEPTMGAFLAPQYTPKVFGYTIGLAVVLGGLGGLYPAWRASNLRPIEALQYE